MNATLNELGGSHLSNPKYIIRSCLYSDSLINIKDDFDIKSASFVDYNNIHKIEKSTRTGDKFEEDLNHGFYISQIDTSDKYSLNYLNCTGIGAIGKSKESNKNLSFLTHQDPLYFLSKKRNKKRNISNSEYFVENLKDTLKSMKELCKPGTIDIVVFGGLYFKTLFPFLKGDYEKSIKLLSDTVKEVMGFYPVIIGGPSSIPNNEAPTNKGVFLKTQERQVLYDKIDKNIKTNICYIGTQVNGILNSYK